MNKETIIILAAVIIVLGLVIVIGLIFRPFKKPKTMTRAEIATYRQKLRNILNTEKDEKKRLEALKELAKEVGAGYVHTQIASTTTKKTASGSETSIYQNPISESELVLNINNALQTETMIDVCKTASRNFWFTMFAALAAILSALAAWVAIIKRVR